MCGGHNKDFGAVSQKDLTRSLVPSVAQAAQGLNQKGAPLIEFSDKVRGTPFICLQKRLVSD